LEACLRLKKNRARARNNTLKSDVFADLKVLRGKDSPRLAISPVPMGLKKKELRRARLERRGHLPASRRGLG
jgi:hypothetical protein